MPINQAAANSVIRRAPQQDPKRPHGLVDAINDNNALVDRFVSTLTLEDDDGDDRRTEYQRHRVAHGLSLKNVYSSFLEELRLPDPDDSNEHTALLLQISRYLEDNPEATCSVFVMRPNAPIANRKRESDDTLGNFFQGANPSKGPNVGEIYPGDRNIRAATDLTIQIHTLRLTPHEQGEDQNTYDRVCVVATYVPQQIGRSWVVQ